MVAFSRKTSIFFHPLLAANIVLWRKRHTKRPRGMLFPLDTQSCIRVRSTLEPRLSGAGIHVTHRTVDGYTLPLLSRACPRRRCLAPPESSSGDRSRGVSDPPLRPRDRFGIRPGGSLTPRMSSNFFVTAAAENRDGILSSSALNCRSRSVGLSARINLQKRALFFRANSVERSLSEIVSIAADSADITCRFAARRRAV